MKRALVAFALLAVALPVQAATIGSQTDASVQQDFVTNPTEINGWPGNTFTLPALTGTLKAFDAYLAISSYSQSSGTFKNSPPPSGVQVVLGGGANCPTSSGTDQNSGTFLMTDLGMSVDNGPVDGEPVGVPVLAHFVLSGAGNIPVYTGQTDCTIQFSGDGSTLANFDATQVAAGTTDQLYFVGYDSLGTPPTLSNISITSSNASTTLAKAGDTVTLTFSADTPDFPTQTPVVTIGSHSSTDVLIATSSTDGSSQTTFEASTTLDSSDTDGALAFSIQVANKFGDNSFTTSTTTDGTAVTFDNTAPVLAITAGPAEAAVSTSSPTVFEFTNDDPSAATQCSFDGTATSTCTSPLSQVLAGGAHTLVLDSTDAAGNEASTTRDFTVDATVPVLSIDSGPAAGATVSTSSVSFTFSTDASSTECSYDGAATSTCSSPFATTSADGSHTFAVSATNTDGNTAYLSRTFTIDTAPAPAPAAQSGTGGGGNGPIVGSGPLSFGYQAPLLGGGGVVLGTSTDYVASSTSTSTSPMPQSMTAGQMLLKSLWVGKSGPQVTLLQQTLTAYKFYSGPVTGYYGMLTMAAVQRFQKSQGLETVGSMGPLTRAALNKFLSQ